MASAPVIELRRPMRTLADRDDEELILLVRADSTDAMAALVARYHARLTSFCAKYTRDFAAAEELVQETFLRMWRARASYRSEGKLAVLLYTTARNLCRNHARSAHRRARPLEIVPPPAADPVDALPDKLRDAVVLRFEHQLAYDQIAEVVGSNESTVRSRVHHGLAQLRAL